MSELCLGILKVRQSKGKTCIQVMLGGTAFNTPAGEFSANLVRHDGEEVEFERVNGQPKKVRPKGLKFIAPSESDSTSTASQTNRQRRHQSHQHPSQKPPEPNAIRGDFHNPFNFMPAPPRNTDDKDLGDHQPVGHDCYQEGRYSGRIMVQLTVITPLLLPDTDLASKDQNGHKTFPIRLDSKGLPVLAPSGVRGMLRSAFEAITNSRMHNFPHKARLAYRMPPKGGLQLIPARVVEQNGEFHFQLLTGTSKIGPQGPDGPQYAAWLPSYRQGQEDPQAPRYPHNCNRPQHGDQVQCWVEKFQHSRWDQRTNGQRRDFQLWRVRSIAPSGESLQKPQPPATRPQRTGGSHYEPLPELRKISGWVFITNANINRKHDERVFFVDGQSETLPCTEEHKRMWRELIANYQALHEDEIQRRSKHKQSPAEYLGNEPGKTAWSRHVYTDGDRELRQGTLCYVRLNSDKKKVEAVFPVSISRELYPASPWDLLDESLRPAESLDQLSPADRVFGWVNAKANGAHRGFLRVGPIHCESSAAEAVEPFARGGLPLAILAAPKPQLGVFYVAEDEEGRPQIGQRKAEAGYKSGKGLRGRKVYPHQRSLPQAHWDKPMEDRTQKAPGSSAHFQEYRRPRTGDQEQRDDQNRSVLGWVKPGAKFNFHLDITNLSEVELGALLWLLTLPDKHFLRFGGGKPLGFGSVELRAKEIDVRTPEDLRERYLSWIGDANNVDTRPTAIAAFKAALVRACDSPGPFEELPFIASFLVACKGWNDELPIHYPRRSKKPNPDGENFKWFVENERQPGPAALTALPDDKGLPRYELP